MKQAFLEGGGKIFVCAPCLKAHAIEEGELIAHAQIAGAAFLMELAQDSIVFTY